MSVSATDGARAVATALFDRFSAGDAQGAVSYTHLTLPTNREV